MIVVCKVNFIAELVTELVNGILRYFLEKGTGKQLRINEQGLYELHMPRFYKILGYCSILLALAFLSAMIFIEESKESTYILFILILLMFGVIGAASILFYLNHKVLFDDTYIEVTNIFGKIKTTRWVDLHIIKFNYNSGVLVLKDYANQKLSVHQHLIGLSLFMEFMKTKTSLPVEQLTMPYIRK